MYEFWYQVEYMENSSIVDGGEFFGNTAQECADYIKEQYKGYRDFEILSIVRVENDWK